MDMVGTFRAWKKSGEVDDATDDLDAVVNDLYNGVSDDGDGGGLSAALSSNE